MTLKIGWLHEAEYCLGTWLHEADDWQPASYEKTIGSSTILTTVCIASYLACTRTTRRMSFNHARMGIGT